MGFDFEEDVNITDSILEDELDFDEEFKEVTEGEIGDKEEADIENETESTRDPLPEYHTRLKAGAEAILFSMGESVSLSKIAEGLNLEKEDAKIIIDELKEDYEKEDRGIRIVELEGNFQLCTKAEMYDYLIPVAKTQHKYVLTDVLLETLSIIAYKQPITRAEIEKIRGVSCDHAVNKLVEYNLITELGRLDAPGRPLLFGTTEEFLRCFNVSSTDELPSISTVQVEEFKKQAEEEIYVTP